MTIRKFAALLAAAAMPLAASAAEPTKQVLVKATICKLRSTAYQELKLDDAFGKDGTKFLDADELDGLMKKATAAGMEVVSAPRMLVLDGQAGVFAVGQPKKFVTGVEVGCDANGGATFRPKEETFEVGVNLRCSPQVAADGRMAVLRLMFAERSVADKVAMLPVTSLVAPVFEGGSQGVPVPFTQYIQRPVVNTAACEKTVAVPTGRCVLVRGGSRECETRTECKIPGLSDIPGIERLFRSTATGKDTEHTLLALTVVVDPTAADVGKAGPPQAVAAPVMPVAAVARPVPTPPTPMPAGMQPADSQVLVETMVLRVSGKTCTELGLGLKPGWAASVTVDPATFKTTLKALKEAGKVDVLTRPLLLLTDNQRGHFQVGSKYPLGSPAGQPQPNYGTIGFEMHCTPRISPAGLSTQLRVEFTESRPGNPVMVNGALQPTISNQSVEASVRVPTSKSVLMEVGSRAGETHVRKMVGNRDASTGERPAATVEVADTEHTLLLLTPKLDWKAEDYAAEMSWSAKDVAAIQAKPTMTGGVAPMCRMAVPNFATGPSVVTARPVPMPMPSVDYCHHTPIAEAPPRTGLSAPASAAFMPRMWFATPLAALGVPNVPINLPLAVVPCPMPSAPPAGCGMARAAMLPQVALPLGAGPAETALRERMAELEQAAVRVTASKHAEILKILMADYHAACKAGDTAKARTIAAHCLELDPTCFGK